jgi:3-dehydroquinate synthase
MRRTIDLKISTRQKLSKILIEEELLEKVQFDELIGPKGRKIAVISDETVATLHAEKFVDKLKTVGYRAHLFTFPPGERSKTSRTALELQEQLLEWGVDRDSFVIGMGGGVVTDIAGYVAATLLRGINHIVIPTTLLAMVDASVGGKVGVNTKHGKNLIGAFWQPLAVLIDTKVLQTLPLHVFKEGICEMLKHGVIADADYFHLLANEASRILEQETALVIEAIAKSCEIKATIVEEDECERSGKRRLLNFGHTVGHALEKISNYTITHGDAVAAGMITEAKLAAACGLLKPNVPTQLLEGLNAYGIQPCSPISIATSEVLIEAMRGDKKSKNDTPRFVMITDIGTSDACNGNYCRDVDEELLTRVLEGEST